MPSTGVSGEVITFYSYKGGTGRTMALANTACLLARQELRGKGVLMVDWDLEAPGLHRYFCDQFKSRFGKDQENERKLDEFPGLIDLFEDFNNALGGRRLGNLDEEEEAALKVLGSVDLSRFIIETDIPSLSLLKAGQFGERYSSRVNGFRWDEFFRRSSVIIRLFAERLAREYQYVLVDSRTGLTDISGICTTLMPEKLVVVFTPNRQSLTGVLDLVRSATQYRRESDDLRQLVVFPLPSRFESARPTLRDNWRFGNANDRIPGYQPLFEKLLTEVYDLDKCQLGTYLDEVQIQHVPDYAYGEEIAVLIERSRDSFSLTRAFERFAFWLTESAGPWDKVPVAPARDSAEQLARVAEAVYLRFTSSEQEAARGVLLELVRVSPREGADSRRTLPASDMNNAAAPILIVLSEAGLVVTTEASGEKTVELASEDLVRSWKRLQEWINADRQFLLWRQRLQERRVEWEHGGRDTSMLLRGKSLAEAKEWFARRPDEIDEREQVFIRLSRRQWGIVEWGIAIAACASVLVLVLSYWQSLKNEKQELGKQLLNQAKAQEAERPDLAMLLAVEAVRANNSIEARTTLRDMLANSPLTAILHSPAGVIETLAISADGRILASSSSSGEIGLWSVRDRKLLQTMKYRGSTVDGLSLDAEGKVLAVTGSEGIDIFLSSRLISSIPERKASIGSAILNPNGTLVAIVERGGVSVWKADGSLVKMFWGGEEIRGVTFTSNSDLAALIGSERVEAFNIDNNVRSVVSSEICSDGLRLPEAFREVSEAKFNFGFLALQCSIGEIEIYDVEHQVRYANVRIREFGSGLFVSGDGRLYGFLSQNEAVVFDRHSEDASERIKLGTELSAIAVDNGGTIVVSGGELIGLVERRSLRNRQSASDDRKRACQVANRNLRPAEWRFYFGDAEYRKTCNDLPRGDQPLVGPEGRPE